MESHFLLVMIYVDNKQFSIGLFFDLSKAFDTIDHVILVQQLQCYGIRCLAFNWMKCYISNRSQFVCIGVVNSDLLPIHCGVPPGLILVPWLFLIYINDIVNISNLMELILFSDDTNIFMSDKCLSTLVDRVNMELIKISRWFKINKLSLNVKKRTLSYLLGKWKLW